MRTIDLVEDVLSLDFPYNEEEVQALLSIAGARWSKLSKRWIVPITSLEEVRAFAVKYRLSLSPDLLKFKLPPRRAEGLTLRNGTLYLYFRYDQFKERRIRDVEGVSFEAGYWTAPMSSIVDVVRFCETFDIPVPAHIWEAARYVKLQSAKTSAAGRR